MKNWKIYGRFLKFQSSKCRWWKNRNNLISNICIYISSALKYFSAVQSYSTLNKCMQIWKHVSRHKYCSFHYCFKCFYYSYSYQFFWMLKKLNSAEANCIIQPVSLKNIDCFMDPLIHLINIGFKQGKFPDCLLNCSSSQHRVCNRHWSL